MNLSGMQLVYDNGYGSPWCIAENARDEDETIVIDIDHRKRIEGI